MDILSRPPTIETPISKRLAYIDSLQWHRSCAGFERRAVVCYESYGFDHPKCNDYIEDLRECIYGNKGEMRVVAMQRERITQYKEGTRKELYAPPPPDDAY